jgi:hypothetical protein
LLPTFMGLPYSWEAVRQGVVSGVS